MGWRPHKVGGEIGSNPVWATNCGLEQESARRAHNPKVRGANPLSATKNNFRGYSLILAGRWNPIIRILIAQELNI